MLYLGAIKLRLMLAIGTDFVDRAAFNDRFFGLVKAALGRGVDAMPEGRWTEMCEESGVDSSVRCKDTTWRPSQGQVLS
eukprot:COSAG04_NODE_21116_length_379_cov_1.607143_1_plen_78_part_10